MNIRVYTNNYLTKNISKDINLYEKESVPSIGLLRFFFVLRVNKVKEAKPFLAIFFCWHNTEKLKAAVKNYLRDLFRCICEW